MAKEEDALQPKKGIGTKARDFGRAIWDPEKKLFIGRSGTSWAKIGLFYMIFYSCLAGFFAVMLVGFFSTLSDTEPTQQKMYSLIKANPGMGFRPMRPNFESTLIKFNAAEPKTYEDLITSIKETLKDYDEKAKREKFPDAKYVNCTDKGPAEGEVCEFSMSDLGTYCTEENDYGYKDGAPCVLLKINRVFLWKPDMIDCNGTSEGAKKLKTDGDRCEEDHIGITCDGEVDSDADNLNKVEFYPPNGFSSFFYPYLNHQGYESPLVFARFANVNKGAVIQVWCKLWAKNIKHHKNDKAGSIHFELMVDVPEKPKAP